MEFFKGICEAMATGAALGAPLGVTIGEAVKQLTGKEDAVIKGGAIGTLVGAGGGLVGFLCDASGETGIGTSESSVLEAVSSLTMIA
ncbi:MAG: hypothetical protein E7211_18635 [Clostridium lundense]|nr:hypothetical protein [Clostridium lundense]